MLGFGMAASLAIVLPAWGLGESMKEGRKGTVLLGVMIETTSDTESR